MKTHFIHEDFLLESKLARELYHGVAATLPIIDYHCHLPPDQIARNHRFETITEIWLKGDHYKWRAMRTNGVSEVYCTGHASDWEKFEAWAKTVPHTLRNPLYHWTHMELADPFGITDRLLNEKSARAIYEELNARLREDAFRTQGILSHFRVAVVCTTDDPVDSLEHHAAYASSPAASQPSSLRLCPAWRPDRALAVDDLTGFNAWVDKLQSAADINVCDYDSFWVALEKRHLFFHEQGCRLSDHGLETVYAESYTDAEAAAIFAKARNGKALSGEQCLKFRSALLHRLAIMNHARGWVQQFHLGALRNNNTRMLRSLGPDMGFDSIGDFEIARPLARFLDRLDSTDQLARTILYNLNPRDNELMATMIGNFQDGTIPGKMQFGSAWWFLDQLDGMQKQLNALSNLGLLSRFVGMLTDSRSFLSYSRHEYFRRLLCNIIGEDVRRGLVPDDRALLGTLVRDVCFENAKKYFPFANSVDATSFAGI
ncbi:MAG: glucuronate isomerase [Deltaproteobacteria bacterium]|nr:glucuronate isomerase [Deltaproteobacteria bacterium]